MITKELLIILFQEILGMEQVKESHYSHITEQLKDEKSKKLFDSLVSEEKANQKLIEEILALLK